MRLYDYPRPKGIIIKQITAEELLRHIRAELEFLPMESVNIKDRTARKD